MTHCSRIQPPVSHARVELLAPARDFESGKTALDCGADAVYIGAPRFGARAAVGNSLEDIAALARRAHLYWARVYITLNTLLFDHELGEARDLAWRLYEAGADGLIIQDVGLLEGDLPPLPLIASTQMHNHTPERVAFLERVGFRRAILARELELDEIRAIRAAAPRIELECFVHGALCVSYSGQCYLSYALGGRSGNRGECAQPCRKPYTLTDAQGGVVVRDSHLLSLRDLNLSRHIPELLAAGVTSFKIEGRLKDRTYVANVVAHYRAVVDAALKEADLLRSSSGTSEPGFKPDLAKTFHRDYTTYFLHGRGERTGRPETPKMTGEPVGRVASIQGANVTLEETAGLHPGDGLCFFDAAGKLRGTLVNAASGRTVTLEKTGGLQPGAILHRNHDHAFLESVRRARPERRIAVRFEVNAARLRVSDEDGNSAELALQAQPARQSGRAAETMRRQLAKTGGTEFRCECVEVASDPPFLPVAQWNTLRREALAALRAAREAARPLARGGALRSNVPFPGTELSYLGNVLNRDAEAFYRRHGVARIEPGAETGLDLRGRAVMTTRYCLKHQLGACPREGRQRQFAEPLALIGGDGRRLELGFDCANCRMEVRLED
ncbi:MAG: U32 family peptidase [Bryobacteraceae bacterium]